MIVDGEMQIIESLFSYHMQIDLQLHPKPEALHQFIHLEGCTWVIAVVFNRRQEVLLDQVGRKRGYFFEGN